MRTTLPVVNKAVIVDAEPHWHKCPQYKDQSLCMSINSLNSLRSRWSVTLDETSWSAAFEGPLGGWGWGLLQVNE